MKTMNSTTKVLFFCLSLIPFFLLGCSGKRIKLINTELKVSNIGGNPYALPLEDNSSEEQANQPYYRFDFETDVPLFSRPDHGAFLVQVRLSFWKNGEKIFSSFGTGPHSISQNPSALHRVMRGDRYVTLFFRSLGFRKDRALLKSPIEDLDFDYLEIQIVSPTMTPFYPRLFQSNITTYSRAYFLEQMSKKRETLTIVE